VRLLGFEKLEDRSLLAITVFHAGGIMTFTGDGSDDLIKDIKGVGAITATVRYTTKDAAGGLVEVNTFVNAADVEHIKIATNGGDDEIDLGGGFGVGLVLDWLEINSGAGDDIIVSVPSGFVLTPSSPNSPWPNANIRIDCGPGTDVVTGGDDPEYVLGQDDNDSIEGNGGDDYIFGGPGPDDILDGGPGGDYIEGGDGYDDVRGGSGEDSLFGDSPGTVECQAVSCGDIIRGGTGFDIIFGGIGDDEIFGEDDYDVIYGNSGDDTISGGGGPDEIFGGAGADTMSGGDQNDHVWSGGGPGTEDQPYNAILPPGGNAGTPDMMGTGQAGCDLEDSHPDYDQGCPPGVWQVPVAVSDGYHDTQTRYISWANPGVAGNDLNVSMSDTIQLVADVQHGTLSLDADGGFSYTPDGNYWGDDRFTYRVLDGTAYSNTATVVLTMDPPTVDAMDDSYWSFFGSPISESVIGNDMNVNEAQYVANSGPSVGSLTFNSDGTFTYAPPTGYTGTVMFQYIGIHSGSGARDGPATVTIDVWDMLALVGTPGSSGAPRLDSAALAVMYQAAIDRWRAAGVSDSALSAGLADVRLLIADLPGVALGGTVDGKLIVDTDGAGRGWFIDVTPGDDLEFAQPANGSEWIALGGSPAFGHVDLLTVLEHEIGHLLGLKHSDTPGNIMQDKLTLGTRRWAQAVDVLMAQLNYEASDRRRR
jgi:hypothetical protein